jgi:hypothetical protein
VDRPCRYGWVSWSYLLDGYPSTLPHQLCLKRGNVRERLREKSLCGPRALCPSGDLRRSVPQRRLSLGEKRLQRLSLLRGLKKRPLKRSGARNSLLEFLLDALPFSDCLRRSTFQRGMTKPCELTS